MLTCAYSVSHTTVLILVRIALSFESQYHQKHYTNEKK